MSTAADCIGGSFRDVRGPGGSTGCRQRCRASTRSRRSAIRTSTPWWSTEDQLRHRRRRAGPVRDVALMHRRRPARAVVRTTRRATARLGPPLRCALAGPKTSCCCSNNDATFGPEHLPPWDLQHIHFPQYFSSDLLAFRDVVWRTCAEQATYVLVASQFVRADVVNASGLTPVVSHWCRRRRPPFEKAMSSPLPARAAIRPLSREAGCTERRRLLEAVALLDQRGLSVPLVCPRQPTDLPFDGAAARADALIRFWATSDRDRLPHCARTFAYEFRQQAEASRLSTLDDEPNHGAGASRRDGVGPTDRPR